MPETAPRGCDAACSVSVQARCDELAASRPAPTPRNCDPAPPSGIVARRGAEVPSQGSNARVMKTLFRSGTYAAKGSHSTNPCFRQSERAGSKYDHEPVSRLSRRAPR